MAIIILRCKESGETGTKYIRVFTDINCGSYQVDDTVLYIVLEGRITIINNNIRTIYCSGEAFFLLAGTKVAFEKGADFVSGNFTALCIFMSRDLFWHLLIISPNHTNGFKESITFPPKHTITNTLVGLILYMFRFLGEEMITVFEKIIAIVLVIFIYNVNVTLFVHILFYCRQDNVNIDMLVMNNIILKIHEICALINTSYQKLYYRCRKNGLSHLSSLCFNNRMETAREMLVTSKISVLEISTKVGYGYPNSFSRAFTRKYKISPSKYRKQNIK